MAASFESWIDGPADAFDISLADAREFFEAAGCAQLGIELDLDAIKCGAPALALKSLWVCLFLTR